ncbi:glycosyltransferase [Nocardioides glacieisoli]|uniref:Glycosyltransferase n=1 Tax=Nocardioides glacieisoli TaxID=1168730 RepID=A0A4Q2RWP1_9ACTN|nr:glycosyltransferase [Nocardioides glacieisoli]RYB92375.1 glycosyltransferase [Nocardioides glacieisoli]
MGKPRVVVIATTIGYDGVPHAGGTYMKALSDLMSPLVDLTVMVPGSRGNREAAEKPGAPERTIPLGLEAGRNLLERAANRASLILDARLRRRDPGLPYLPLLVGLAGSAEARRLVREADVIDLQWSDSIRLVHLLRRMNPRARIVGTFHDVMSQSFAREPQDTEDARRYWHGVVGRSRRHEARMVRALDEVLVFSDKDAVLLGSPESARVVRPPLHDGDHREHVPPAPAAGTVLVVSYLARQENDKAAIWTVTDVWPTVSARVPRARLRLVGGGAGDQLKDAVGPADRVELAGFVDDLGPEYAAAAVALVPVMQGAGVKFKTIEAVLHGVPVVSTHVGAEGVGPDELFVQVADDPVALSDALVRVLTDPAAVIPVAEAAQRWAEREFSAERFVESVSAAWAL